MTSSAPRAAGRDTCRVCGSRSAVPRGVVEYLAGSAAPVADCEVCGCRTTPHVEGAHEAFHRSVELPYYASYRELATECRRLFESGAEGQLRRRLSEWEKYRFVIDELSDRVSSGRILEVGCSRGYLTSWFLLRGAEILGVDVSQAAVDDATRSFGDHFAIAGSKRILDGAPYASILHVGLIGCVSDPVGLTRELLEFLQPGGVLVFNAPNKLACALPGQLWLDSAPPPDLITLFPPGFFARAFAEEAVIEERVSFVKKRRAAEIWASGILRERWVPPTPAGADGPRGGQRAAKGRLLKRVLVRLGASGAISKLLPTYPAEFGYLVKLTKRSKR